MKIQELRIGNLANHSELGSVTVIGISNDHIHCVFNNEKH